jgi:peptide/nickel transport system substrate-binding protein
MEEIEENTPVQPQRWHGRRGASTAAAAAILIVVIVVVGAGGYFGLNAATPGSTSGGTTTQTGPTTCEPATAIQCSHRGNGAVNDVILTSPYQAGFGQPIASVAQGTTIPASLSVAKGETVNTWMVTWGDGTSNTSTSPLLTHTYNNLGTYVLSGNAVVGTGTSAVTHNGTGYLYPIEITPSITTSTAGSFPTLSTTFSNGTGVKTQANPWLQGGGTVSVSATLTAAPPNTAWVPGVTSLTASAGGTLTTTSATATGAAGTVAFSVPGTYLITFVSPITNVVTSVTIYQNYTWSVFVSPSNLPAGCGSCSTSGSNSGATDPHPGTIDTYEVVPGGATSIDPAIDYESVGYEVIANVYQTLVYYNGSSSSSFIPEIATCVPGTAQCTSLYGSDLIVNNASTGLPQYWTFVIDKNAHFYDPAHSASWGVYPTDVMSSLARTASFADLPFFASNPGWIQTQSFANFGNATWDGGIHYPYNNTPQGILSAFLVNDSTYCPSAAMTSENGCITINAWGGGADWPFFLELVSDPDGGGIVPCGWFGAQGAGLPGFTTSAPNGDGPCKLPDGGTTTNNTAWSTYLSSGIAATGWDTFQENAYNTPNVFPSTRFSAVGSGPYYVVSINKGVGYVLQANPAYGQPNCAGQQWCQPPAGQYAHTVNVFWEPSDQVGIQEYLQGQADFATIQTSDTATMLNLQAAGKIGITNVPTINVFFDPINMGVNLNQISGYYTGSYNMPSGVAGASDFFSYVGLREFLVNSFPYTQDLQQVLSVDGIVYGLNYGGAIPHFMGNYYATNVTWPAGQPNFNATQVGGAAWWWAQATTPGTPYYDPQLASCTTAVPCTFPVEGEQADTLQNGQFPIWANYISAISGGKLQVAQEVDLTFAQLVQYFLASTAYVSPLTVSVLGWLPDYPDPTDYVAPLYLPDATYTGPDAVGQVLANYTAATFTNSSTTIQCPGGGSWTNLTYWAQQFGVPQVCQGDAYAVMTWASEVAGALPVGAERTLYYNLVSHIANDLAMYIYQFQEQGVGTYAPWINPNTIDTNVVLAGDALWFQIGGNGFLP